MTKKELEVFLGLVNFFGRFIPNYSDLTEPLNTLRSKTIPFSWGILQIEAFNRIKNILSQKPVIQPFDKDKETVFTTDASEKLVAAVLFQQGHPIMYFSRRLTTTEARYSNIETEALAIVRRWTAQKNSFNLISSYRRIIDLLSSFSVGEDNFQK